MSETTEQSDQLLLSRCDIAKCEAMCCHDGVYLMEGEEEFLIELVSLLPDLKSAVPEAFIVDGYWQGELFGRKTATRPHDYSNPNFPSHFPRTRCVFADTKGLCELEKFARERGEHPWKFKPAACWLFPLSIEDSEPVPPPVDKSNDPYQTDNYPGYVTFVPCGQHDLNGKVCNKTLEDELSYLKSLDSLPILGTNGHSAGNLVKGK